MKCLALGFGGWWISHFTFHGSFVHITVHQQNKYLLPTIRLSALHQSKDRPTHQMSKSKQRAKPNLLLHRSQVVGGKSKAKYKTKPKSASAAAMVKFVESEGEWMALMEESKEKLVVVDFTASW